MVITDDNILYSLLYHYEEELALKFMGYYSKFIDKDLFTYSLEHGNKMFIKESLLMGAFDKQIFKEEEVIGNILQILKDGGNTNFLLNVLLTIDISMWKNKYLKELLEIFNNYSKKGYDCNLLLLSYNPLMSIALTCELLSIIGESRKRFENESKKIGEDLLELGKMYNSKVEDEREYENLIMDCDFKNRSVLKIITQNSFGPLMH